MQEAEGLRTGAGRGRYNQRSMPEIIFNENGGKTASVNDASSAGDASSRVHVPAATAFEENWVVKSVNKSDTNERCLGLFVERHSV